MRINIHLPVEITTEILSRLPVDSVIQCKLVCKTWRSLINSPTFVEAHTRNHLLRVRLDHEHNITSDANDLFILLTKQSRSQPESQNNSTEFHLGKYINADDDQKSDFRISKPLSNIDEDFKYWWIIGSSNGLICLEDGTSIYVYNPCTSEYVNLGHQGFKTDAANEYGIGFGYHPCTNEYKVVLIYYRNGKGRIQEREVSVYVLGSGKWRSQEEEEEELSNSYSWDFTPGVLTNGALHWLRTFTSGTIHYAIVSFDLADEKFRSNSMIMPSVPAAAPSAPDIPTWAEIGLLGGCLCMTQHNQLISQTSDIWVMNNNDKSWTMKFKIKQKKNGECYSPIARLGNGCKILLRALHETETIASYDIETGNIDYDIVHDGLKYSDHHFEAIPYVKSFVSLKALGEEGENNA